MSHLRFAVPEISVLVKVILFCCTGGKLFGQLFWEEAHTEIRHSSGLDEQSHTLEKVMVAVCWLVCFAFRFWSLVASLLVESRERCYRSSCCTAVVLFGLSYFGVFWGYD